jgi:hypothetical protein
METSRGFITMGNQREVFLTFDVEGPPFKEDFMNGKTLNALFKVLCLLENYNLKGLFFIPGTAAKKIARCPIIMKHLEKHEIGYHSSTHSLRPNIFEYTDLENYDDALEASLKREASEIDLLTGEIVGEGGILLLRKIFPNKIINCFRAPFLCWTPPHLEALKQLGLKFDFSTNFCPTKFCNGSTFYKGITFYPSPIQVDSRFSALGLVDNRPTNRLFSSFLPHELIIRNCTVLMMHPATLMYNSSANHSSEGINRVANHSMSELRTKFNFASHIASFELLLLQLSLLQKMGSIKVTPYVKEAKSRLDSTKLDIDRVYAMSVWAPQHLFGYKPKFLRSHFQRFFRQ